jgi:hypothetical protein
MGDRTTTYYDHDCPEGGEVEQYDAPSSLIFSASCDKCGWTDDRDYYETGEHMIELLTSEQANEKGFCRECGLHSMAAMKSIDYQKYWNELQQDQENQTQ